MHFFLVSLNLSVIYIYIIVSFEKKSTMNLWLATWMMVTLPPTPPKKSSGSPGCTSSKRSSCSAAGLTLAAAYGLRPGYFRSVENGKSSDYKMGALLMIMIMIYYDYDCYCMVWKCGYR